MVWSANAIVELEAVKRFANPKDRGVINDPGLNKAAKGFLEAHASAHADIERKDDRKETIVSIKGDLLVHLIRLEHH